MRLQRVEHPAGGVTSLLLDGDGKRVVAGDEDGVISIWDLDNPDELAGDVEPPFTTIQDLAWLPDRDGFVAVGQGQIGAWRINGSPIGVWPTVDAAAQTAHVVNNELALVAYDDGALRLINFTTGDVLATSGAGERNTGIAPHPDGKRFVLSACNQGGSALRWISLEGDALAEHSQLERNVDHLSAPAINKGGTAVMVADHRLGVFNIDSGARVAGFNRDGSKTRMRLGDGLLVETTWSHCVALGDLELACASPDGPVCIYNVDDARLHLRKGLEKPATALAAAGEVLAAASRDWTISIWWP